MIAATAERQAARTLDIIANMPAYKQRYEPTTPDMAVYNRRREEHARREENERRARDRRYDTIEPLELEHDTTPNAPLNALPAPVETRKPVYVEKPLEHTADAVDDAVDSAKPQGHAVALKRLRERVMGYDGKNRKHRPYALVVFGAMLELSLLDRNSETFSASLEDKDADAVTVPNMTGLTRHTATYGRDLLIEIGAIRCTKRGGGSLASEYIIAPEYRPFETYSYRESTNTQPIRTERVRQESSLNNSKYVRHSLPAVQRDTPPSEKMNTLTEYAERNEVPNIVHRFAERRKHFHPNSEPLRYLPRRWAFLCDRITEPPSEPAYVSELGGGVDVDTWGKILPHAIDQFFNEKRYRNSDYGLALFCEDKVKEIRFHMVKAYALDDDGEEMQYRDKSTPPNGKRDTRDTARIVH